MMNTLIKTLLLGTVLCMAPTIGSYGQSAATKYDEGMALYQNGRYSEAIKRFNEAKILNRSAANNSKCQTMISKCNNALRSKNKKTTKLPEQLTVDFSDMRFEGTMADARIITITTTTPWTATLEPKEAASWCKIERRDSKDFLFVNVNPSNKTTSRRATIKVVSTSDKNVGATVNVLQTKGIPVSMTVSENKLDKLKGKGDRRQISVICNSDTIYGDGRNWMVEDKPDWVTIMNESDVLGTNNNSLQMLFEANPIREVRTGFIVLRSQNATLEIALRQEKGKRRR